MTTTKDKEEARSRRHRRVRAKVVGTSKRPRLSVFKSNRYLYAQLIDDTRGMTLTSVSSTIMKGKTPREKAREVGRGLAKEAKKRKLKEVVFDRGGFAYTGVIREVAEGAREEGLAL
jgi:large subunit ribosomal protein L18